MGFVLTVIGYGWALLGLANMFSVMMTSGDDTGLQAIALIFNMVLFILPGLVVGTLGLRRSA